MTEPTSGEAKVAALRSEIEQTRADLGETVEELAARADVKARAKEKVEETKAQAVATAVEAKDKAVGTVRTSVQERPTRWAVVAAVALLAVAAIVISKRRRAAAQRVTPESLRAEWRKQWEASR
jgi:hypothetical protein